MYLLTNDRYNISDEIFIWQPGSCPGVGLGGRYHGGVGGQNFFSRKSNRFGEWVTHMNGTCTGSVFWSRPPGALGRGQKFNFLNMVMWHIKLKGMSSRPGYTENFNLQSNW